MKVSTLRAGLLAASVLLAASAVQAQTTEEGIRPRGFVTFASDSVGASESFLAVADTERLSRMGAGVQVLNLWRSAFAELSIERTSLDGERVFVHNGQVFSLGIPVQIAMRPVDITGGWRFRPYGRFTPYAGGGLTMVSYKETSDFADANEDVSETYKGLVVLGGVEAHAWRFVSVRGEMRFRNIAEALGNGGVSEEFDESSLGGFGFGLKVVVGK